MAPHISEESVELLDGAVALEPVASPAKNGDISCYIPSLPINSVQAWRPLWRSIRSVPIGRVIKEMTTAWTVNRSLLFEREQVGLIAKDTLGLGAPNREANEVSDLMLALVAMLILHELLFLGRIGSVLPLTHTYLGEKLLGALILFAPFQIS